ncbi:MAG TPA: Flp family type IVb pilin [Thermomicrobiales bacterium]|jgi:pilus assembly protein Flp/PilA
MGKLIEALTKRDGEERGQGLVEYALILVLISIVSIGVMTTVGSHVVDLFTTVRDALLS